MTALVVWRGEVLALVILVAVVAFTVGFNLGWRCRGGSSNR